MHAEFLKAFMQNKVPVTKAMGISVVKSDGNPPSKKR